MALYSFVAPPADVEKMREEFIAGGVGYGDFKTRLFAAIWDYFQPMRARREELASDPAEIDRILSRGAERASAVAAQTVARVRTAVGLA